MSFAFIDGAEKIVGLDRLSDDPDDRDDLMFRHVRPDWQRYELDLYTSKWFDYRFLDPVSATYVYAHAYKTIYRRLYRSTIDHKAAEHIHPLKHEDLFQCPKEVISAIWRGRQHADALGMPYEVFIEFAMEGRLRYWNQRHLPRPQHLYSAHVCEMVMEKWAKTLGNRFFYGRHPIFLTSNFEEMPVQIEHCEWIMTQVKARPSVLNEAYRMNLLPARFIVAEYGQHALEKAQQYLM